MRPNAVVVVTTTLLLLALTACTAAPEPAATPTAAPPTPTATPVATSPLGCDDLVPADIVAATLQGGDGAAVEPVPATADRFAFEDALLSGAGGLACSWRVGSGMPEYNGTDWAYLRVSVLPGASAVWTPITIEGVPAPGTRDVAGVEASVADGDSGWRLSAPVGDAWMYATISAAGLTGAGSRFDGLGGDEMFARLAAAASSAATALQSATADQLDWTMIAPGAREAACTGGLDEQGIVAAEQLDGAAHTYTAIDVSTAEVGTFADAVRRAAGGFDCVLEADHGYGPVPLVRISAVPGYGSLIERLALPDADVAFTALPLADVPAGQDVEAVARRYDDGPSTPVVLRIAQTLYEISGDGAAAVAQAIVHQTY